MKTKKVFFSEVAYILGIIVLALGTAMMKRADFGLSMVVAPAYLLHLKISQYVPAFSFGMAEYSLQAVLLIIMSISLRKFKPIYLFSFVTAVIYGFTLDIAIRFVDILPLTGIAGRIIYYLIGMVLCAFGVSLLFHTYIAPEAYELFVKEISAKSGKDINVIKTVYDCVSCLVAIMLSFAFFGLWHFEGVKLGTIICAFVNGFLIGGFSKMTESVFDFKDAFNLREKFEK
ncbi:MAG: hypothetical protein HDR11_10960 [Lachnospiraceae bacterium]|nr:hypothetical protein [Lachnospiraceae bacterium]